jgi:hypothetical protein
MQLLRQGVSPEKIAFTLALGIILGALVTIHALLAWLVLGIVAFAIFYEMLVPLVRQLWRRIHPSMSPLYGR